MLRGIRGRRACAVLAVKWAVRSSRFCRCQLGSSAYRMRGRTTRIGWVEGPQRSGSPVVVRSVVVMETMLVVEP
jgi:hypothetical protein